MIRFVENGLPELAERKIPEHAVPVIVQNPPCRLSNHHHRTGGVMGDLGADAAEHHSLE